MFGHVAHSLRWGVVALGLMAAPVTPALAQEFKAPLSPILTIDSEKLFTQSAFGLRVQREFEAAGRLLEAENREIETALQEEEQQLTDQRSSLSADEFRTLADAFDAKVQQIRQEQSAKLRVLTTQRDLAQRRFLEAASPVLQGLMSDAGASVIVENRTIFMSALAIDVTALAVGRINAQIGDGSPVTTDQLAVQPEAPNDNTGETTGTEQPVVVVPEPLDPAPVTPAD